LAEGVLFVTLEPCAEGARKPPKSACARRIVAARIKQVWVGREDPYPTVATKGISYLQEMGIEVNLFDDDLQYEISRENADFIKRAEEAAAEYDEEIETTGSLLSPFDAAARASLSDLSETALSAYRNQLGIESDAQRQRTLVEEGLMVEENGELRPTGFCTLLFGRRPRSRHPQAGVLATIEYPGGREEIEDFDGPLIEIPGEVEEWLKTSCRT
jgi:predicted HTH transcriptional regulator